MSFFDDASLVFLPSGQAGKDGKAYSMKPTNGDGDFTFSRGSNLTATRIDSNGLIAKGRENLLLQSNSFDTTWSSSNFTLTSGQSGYDGSNDAWKAAVSTTYNSLSQNFSGSGVYTFSGYFRKGDSNEGIRFNFSASTDTNVYVDLTDGSSTFNGTLIQKSVTDVANGFYRVVVTANLTNPNSIRIFVTNGGTTQVSGNIYIQDAQLEQGLVATEYIESGATTGLAGILEDSPRFDYSGGASCPSLLLEGSRTQLIPQSEYIGNYSTAFGGVIEYDSTIQTPQGANGCYVFYDSDGGSYARIRHNSGGFSIGDKHSHSVFVKGTPNSRMLLGDEYGSGTNDFDLSTKTLVSQGANVESYKIEDYGNGWTRYSVVSVFQDTIGNGNVYSRISVNADSSNKVPLWGWQLEEGSYPTSYIPNHSGGSVTREADVLDRGSNLAYTGAYTLFMEFELTKDAVYFLNSDTSTSYSLFFENDDTTLRFGRQSGDSALVRFQNTFDWDANLGTTIKFVFVKDGREAAMFVNGTKYTPTTNTLTTSNEVLDWRYLNYTTTADRQEQAYIKQLLEFEEALPDNQCIALTS